jgi:uncharacterized membrane protein
MASGPVFLYVATYDDEEMARVDYEAVKELHGAGEIGTYDAAVITKDAEGKVHVNKHEKPTQHGAATGVVVGAVIGVLFPPALIGTAVVGGLAGGLVGHLWKGMSRKDMRELGEMLDDGAAALVVVGKSQLDEVLGKAVTHAGKISHRQLGADSQMVEDVIENAATGAEYQPLGNLPGSGL